MIRGLVLLLLLGGVSTGAGADVRWYVPTSLKPGSPNEVYVWSEDPIGPFTVEVVRDGSPRPLASARGFVVDRPLAVLGSQGRSLLWSAALVAPDALTVAGPVVVRLKWSDGTSAEVPSRIEPREFRVETIALDRAMTELRAKPDPRKDREAAAIWTVYQKFDGRFPWPGGRFVSPVAVGTPTSALFGDTRRYEYSDGTSAQDYHRGTDFAVPVGTPVTAPAPGTVALVADRLLTGGTVVVEHAPGVYSVYFHLSRFVVSKGDRVQTGDRLALSGATGLVTGPHLHWEVRIDGVPVDPFDLVSLGLLDTKGIVGVISSIERSTH